VLRTLKKEDLGCARSLLEKAGSFDKLVDESRARHDQRLVEGVCSPMACKMF